MKMSREEKLERALNTAMDALSTYGSHPIIEMQADNALRESDNAKIFDDDIYDASDPINPWNWRKTEDEEKPGSFKTYDTSGGRCGLCGSVSCSGNCFK